MNSAIGHFNDSGVNLQNEQTPKNAIDWYVRKIVLLENEIAQLRTTTTNNTLNVLDYVTKDEWDHFEGLAMLMLANGATLSELQQRLMGLQ